MVNNEFKIRESGDTEVYQDGNLIKTIKGKKTLIKEYIDANPIDKTTLKKIIEMI